ncbi:MAG: hypothetical protein EOO52_19420 [Gammaproteobacteria bacterium]|nr:MAG: hypothetical protein EOO52_19420 [Gammaproteobacteria bacterium]
MKPTFQTVKRHHYSSEPSNANYKSAGDVYTEIGYNIADLMKQNSGYANTCATRMSLALLKSGVTFSGRLPIKAGTFKNRKVETGAKLLADQLLLPSVLGKPKFLEPAKAASLLQDERGIIFFWKITGYEGGHIDLIETNNKIQICNSHCYFNCKEVWFWSLA